MQVHRGMGAAREFLRLSQQNLAAMDEPEGASAASMMQQPPLQAQAATASAAASGKAEVAAQQPSLKSSAPAQQGKAASMLPNTSFLAMLHGKSQAKPAEKPVPAQGKASCFACTLIWL